jgi:hypothetical protein
MMPRVIFGFGNAPSGNPRPDGVMPNVTAFVATVIDDLTPVFP